jgi:hypothetical protein
MSYLSMPATLQTTNLTNPSFSSQESLRITFTPHAYMGVTNRYDTSLSKIFQYLNVFSYQHCFDFWMVYYICVYSDVAFIVGHNNSC